MLDISESVKDLFRGDFVRKDIRIHFPDGERPDIITKNIYGDGSSFTFTESICSQNNLKFGLAEASVLEFDTVNVDNIKGCRIEASYEVVDQATNRTVSIPLGVFTVDSCKRQNDMRRRRVVAYSGTKLEISPLTMAKLSIPSLNDRSYFLDVDEILGQGGQHKENYTNTSSTEFSGDDAELLFYNAFFSDLENNRYEVYAGFNSKSISVNMTGWNISGGDNPSAWYEIISHPELNVSAWDIALEGIKDRIDELKGILYYQSQTDRENLNAFLQKCEIMLENSVEIDVLQTYNRKKIRTKKHVQIKMDRNSGRIKKSRYPIYNCLDIAGAEGTLKFMSTDSIKFSIVRLGETADEDVYVYDIFAGSLRRNVLHKHARELRRYPMVVRPGQEITMPKVDLPCAEFVREQGEDDYYYCTNIAQNISKALDAIAEIQAGFLHVDRYGIMQVIGITKHFGLYPAENLYPAEELYPEGTDETMTAADSLSVWYDDYEVQPYGAVRVNYKNESGNDEVLTYRFNRSGRNVYYFKDNYIFKTSRWRPAAIRELIDDYFVPAVAGISYRPVEIEMKGIPYMEAGDVITVLTRTGGVEAFVFRRILKGINTMRDSIEARGDEVNADETDDSISSVTIET